MLRIYIYHNSYPLNPKPRAERKKEKIISQTQKDINTSRSLKRTKSTISDIILCNKFDYWCTFTFDRKKHKRYDPQHCKTTMSLWLHRQRAHSPNLQYLIVPEFHKKCEICSTTRQPECNHPDRPKALHFHAMLKNFNGRLADSKKTTKYGQPIYNLSGYRAGLSTAVPIDPNIEAVSAYMQKYITKEMPLIDGKKRYWCSRDLIRPTSTVNGVMKFRLDKIVRGRKPSYINEYYEVQEIAKAVPLTSASTDKLIEVPPTPAAVGNSARRSKRLGRELSTACH